LHVYAISDLHTDYRVNMDWIRSLPCHDPSRTQLEQSVIIVAGDISDSLLIIEETLRLLKEKFWKVFFVPGNHEAWVRGDPERHDGATDSVAKLQRVLQLCTSLGVCVRPAALGRLLLLPLLSWHHKSFDQEPDVEGIPRAGSMTIADFAKCCWPAEVTGPEGHGGMQLAQWADSLNDHLAGFLGLDGVGMPSQTLSLNRSRPHPGSAGSGDAGADVISFSHFLPSQELLPEKRFLTYPNLAKAVGSLPLGDRLRLLKPDVHVFGHTHFSWDATLDDGIRYIQAPLCYPQERKSRLKSISISNPWQKRQEQTHKQGSTNHPGDRPEWLPLLLYQADYTVCTSSRSEATAASSQAAGPGVPAGQPCVQEGGHAQSGTTWFTHPCAEDLLLRLWQDMASCSDQQAGEAVHGGTGTMVPSHSHGSALTQPQHTNSGSSIRTQSHPSASSMQQGQGGDGMQGGEEPHVRLVSWRGIWAPELGGAMWSQHYKRNKRTPEVTELAPWVAPRFAKMLARRAATTKVASRGGR